MTDAPSNVESNFGEAVIQLYELLREVASNPTAHSDDSLLQAALKRQGTLASLRHSWFVNGVHATSTPMSLNTLKHYCDLNITGGFRKFDTLRKEALDALTVAQTRPDTSNKRTLKGMNLRIQELEDTLDKSRKANFILLQALSQSLTAIASIRNASTKQLQDKRADEYIKTIRAIVSMNSTPYDELPDNSNVTPIIGR
ncbi:hypothetical protein [Pseudomonas sp. EA_105y_Pfl2_R69]|uniref:hypothetical protein n=1 Tax=Pseudomonas sp. EA_105y_Pfl2_R69 TaxID=3088683 RepID=UPI0030DBFA60